MRWSRPLPLVLALALLACGSADLVDPNACGPDGECPPSFECALSGQCVRKGGAVIDATAAADAAVGAALDAALDAAAVPDAPPGTLDTIITAAPPAFTPNAREAVTFTSPGAPGATFSCALDGAAATPCASPFEASLGEGAHTLAVAAVVGERRDETPATASWTVDLTPPDTTLDGPSGSVSTSDARFDLGASEPATFECALDGAPFAPCTTPHALVGLPPGAHVLLARAVDRAGNRDPEPAEARWTIDVTGPAVVLDGLPAADAVTADTAARFTFTSEPGATFACSLDDAPFAACTSPAAFTVGGGAHRFAVRAEDALGNQGPAAARSWTVDDVGPTTMLSGSPAADAVSNDPAASFTFTAEAGAQFRCSVDGAPFAPCVSPRSLVVASTEGAHGFAVHAIDALGNVGPTVARAWRLDLTAPSVMLSGTPADGDVTNRSQASFTFTSEAGARFACSRDGAAYASCTSPQSYTVTGGDGAHRFAVRATDVAGNTGPESTIAWTIVTAGPTVTIGGTPAEGAATNQPVDLTFAAESASRFECRRDGGAFAACTSPQRYDYPAGGAADGAHRFEVQAFDALGNPGPVAARTFVWDTVGPTIATLTGDPPEGGTTNRPPTYSFTASEPGATFECQWDALGFHACDGQDTAPFSTGDADHTFTVRALDGLGNVGPSATRQFHLDAQSPTVFIDTRPTDACPGTTGPRIGVQVLNTPVTFTFHADEAGSTFVCGLEVPPDQLPTAPCTTPITYSNLSLGTHNFVVCAIDPAGNRSQVCLGQVWTNVAVCP